MCFEDLVPRVLHEGGPVIHAIIALAHVGHSLVVERVLAAVPEGHVADGPGVDVHGAVAPDDAVDEERGLDGCVRDAFAVRVLVLHLIDFFRNDVAPARLPAELFGAANRMSFELDADAILHRFAFVEVDDSPGVPALDAVFAVALDDSRHDSVHPLLLHDGRVVGCDSFSWCWKWDYHLAGGEAPHLGAHAAFAEHAHGLDAIADLGRAAKSRTTEGLLGGGGAGTRDVDEDVSEVVDRCEPEALGWVPRLDDPVLDVNG